MPKVSIGSKKQIAKVWESNIRQLLQVVFRKLSLQIYRVNAFLLSLYLRTNNFQTIDFEVQKIFLFSLFSMLLIHFQKHRFQFEFSLILDRKSTRLNSSHVA